jgi:hypothetical protein
MLFSEGRVVKPAIHAYHPYTATGKLKALKTATTPSGFGTNDNYI